MQEERYSFQVKLENVEFAFDEKAAQDQLADGPGSLIRMLFGVHRLTGRRYGFYTADGSPLAPTVRDQIYALRTPETVPEAAFETYRPFVPPEPVAKSTEPPEELTGTLSERIKASVTVLEFVSQYVDLKPTAGGAVGLCPFHDDHHPSLGVNATGNYWNCWAGCGGGSVVDFWMAWRKCDFTTAVREEELPSVSIATNTSGIIFQEWRLSSMYHKGPQGSEGSHE
jgi:hypothetical protein